MEGVSIHEDKYLEDLSVGDVWTSDPFRITEDLIVDFAKEYDPQPFHIDREVGKNSKFGSLIASGWQLPALAMRSFVLDRPYGRTPVVGIGVDELRWLQPVRPDDVLTVHRKIIDIVPSRTRRDRGIVKTEVTVRNQADVQVMVFTIIAQMQARGSLDGNAS